jgi:hypothetical protein
LPQVVTKADLQSAFRHALKRTGVVLGGA